MDAAQARGFVAGESGAAMVEFALIAALLFTLIFAFIDFARALYLYNNLTNAAREGARFAAVQFGTLGPCQADQELAVITRTASRIREFNINWADDPAQYVDVVCDPNGAVVPNMVTVTIRNYPFRSITPLPFLQNITLGSALIPVDATVRFEGAAD